LAGYGGKEKPAKQKTEDDDDDEEEEEEEEEEERRKKTENKLKLFCSSPALRFHTCPPKK
jgi:CO dehydrogenase/acetyl-CoA synthase beta subunit